MGAYVQTGSHDSLVSINVGLLKTGITAISNLSSHLQHVVLQTGGKVLPFDFVAVDACRHMVSNSPAN